MTTAKAVQAELRKVRERGYAMVVDDFIMGEVALAAAVVDAEGVPLGALHLSGSSSQWPARSAPLASWPCGDLGTPVHGRKTGFRQRLPTRPGNHGKVAFIFTFVIRTPFHRTLSENI
nr:IclR family transcriptional regulator C-terminal domain-containing protein [Delftia tsuruhatensis]